LDPLSDQKHAARPKGDGNVYFQRLNWQELQAWQADERALDAPCAELVDMIKRIASKRLRGLQPKLQRNTIIKGMQKHLCLEVPRIA